MIHLEPLGRVGGLIVLVNSYGLEIYRPAHPPQVMAEILDSSFILPSIQRMTLGRLIVVRTVEIMVLFFTVFALEPASLLVMILDSITSISILDDVLKIPLVPVVLIQSL
jgi:hypothetical protein